MPVERRWILSKESREVRAIMHDIARYLPGFDTDDVRRDYEEDASDQDDLIVTLEAIHLLCQVLPAYKGVDTKDWHKGYETTKLPAEAYGFYIVDEVMDIMKSSIIYHGGFKLVDRLELDSMTDEQSVLDGRHLVGIRTWESEPYDDLSTLVTLDGVLGPQKKDFTTNYIYARIAPPNA